MGTEILKSFGTLQSELEQAKNSLKGVDENIKRLIGRDPSDFPPRAGAKRSLPEERGRPKVGRNRENNEPSSPKKRSSVSVFKRLSEKYYEDEVQPQKQMISKVIVTSKELPSRQEALAAQSKDEQSKARNRRMFGALLGTLQKFQQEETKLKQKEDKRAQVEKKIEEHEIKEKEEIKKEKQVLFLNRKRKQAEIKMIELKMMRMKEYAVWEESQKPKINFIQTKTKPSIYYLPRRHNNTTRALLDTCRTDLEKMIDKKRQEVFAELQHIEDRMKKNFELRNNEEKPEDLNDDEITDKDESTNRLEEEEHTVVQANGADKEVEENSATIKVEDTSNSKTEISTNSEEQMEIETVASDETNLNKA